MDQETLIGNSTTVITPIVAPSVAPSNALSSLTGGTFPRRGPLSIVQSEEGSGFFGDLFLKHGRRNNFLKNGSNGGTTEGNTSESGTNRQREVTFHYLGWSLEFTDERVETRYIKFLALNHSYEISCTLVALPYFCLVICVIVFNFIIPIDTLPTVYLVICTVLEAIAALCLVIYMRKLQGLTKEKVYNVSSAASVVSKSETGTINPLYETALFEEVLKYSKTFACESNAAILCSRLAGLTELTLILLLATWLIGNAVVEQSLLSIPCLLAIAFLWIIPLHMALTTSVRLVVTLCCEFASKCAILAAFVLVQDSSFSQNTVLTIFFTALVWLSFWIPLLYYVCRKLLKGFMNAEVLYCYAYAHEQLESMVAKGDISISASNIWESGANQA